MADLRQQSIVDYASPQARTPMRLAKKSILHVLPLHDRFEVIETLQGKAGAIAAMIFTGSTMAAMSLFIVNREFPLSQQWWPVALYLAIMSTVIVLALAIIRETWRTTMLTAKDDQLTLQLSHPFSATRYAWPSTAIEHIHVVEFADPGTGRAICEIQITSTFGEILKLFAGHSYGELQEILAHLRNYLQQNDLPEAMIASEAGHPPASNSR